MNAAVAYLVIARGTGSDNLTSFWSSNAIENYTGIGRGNAKRAVNLLAAQKFMDVSGSEKRPRYDLQPWANILYREIGPTACRDAVLAQAKTGEQLNGTLLVSARELEREGLLVCRDDGSFDLVPQDWIWLPNAFVTGAADETPPLERLRQTQDAMLLRLAVDLYHVQHLREDGGISRHVIWQKYERVKAAEFGEFTVWGFRLDRTWMSSGNEVTKPHLMKVSAAEKAQGKSDTHEFFARLEVLEDMRLLEWVPYLWESDGPDAELIHPIGSESGESIEHRIGFAAHFAGEEMLTERQRDWLVCGEGFCLVPVHRHKGKVQAVGVARLRYRPRTKLTSAWWRDQEEKGQAFVAGYEELRKRAVKRHQVA